VIQGDFIRDLLRNNLVGVAAVSLITHYIFRRYEPINIPVVLGLLIGIPALLAIQLASLQSLLTICLYFLTYHVVLVSSIVLYRLSPFHPLARYPGPMLCKVSMIYTTLQNVRGKRHVFLQDLHKKYGDIVRVGPNEVSIRDVSAINPPMGTKGIGKGYIWLGRTLHVSPPPLIGERDPVEHSHRRRPWNRAFSTSSLKYYEPLLSKRARQVANLLLQQTSIVDLGTCVNHFTLDVMGDLV